MIAVLLLLSAAPRSGWCKEKLRVGIRPMSPPYSFLVTRDGVQGVRGYIVDEMVMLGKVMNRDIDFVALGTMEERREYLLTDRIDILALDSEQEASRLGLTYIPEGISLRHHLYVNKDCSSVTCLRDLQGKRVVVISGAPYSTNVRVEVEPIMVPSPLEALTMLNDGVVDVFIAPSERVADYLIDAHGLANILKKGVVAGETPIGFLVRPERKELIEALRDSCKMLSESGKLAIIRDKWFGKPVSGSLLRRYSREISITAALVGMLFVSVVLWNVALNRRVKKVAEDLRRTEQRYQDIIESSPDMIFMVNEAGDVLHANERARRSLPFPPSGDVNIERFMGGGEAGEIKAFMTKVYNDGCDKHEFVMQGTSGQPLEVEIAGRLIQGTLQSEALACLFARNVTERNRMEEDLIQSERLAIIGKMAASMAHEINNPLGIIQANAEDLMFEEGLPGGVRDGLSAIQRNAERAGEITKGLLEASSPKPMSIAPLEVGSLIYDAIFLLGAKGKGRRIEVILSEKPLIIGGDERTLQQVMVNLLFNALDNTREEDSIAVFAQKDAHGGGDTVRIVVSDTGKGIPRDNLPKIFEPFFTSRKGGFGLGLFITRRMVERHDGVIYAESTEGKGTSMFLEFPAHRGKEK